MRKDTEVFLIAIVIAVACVVGLIAMLARVRAEDECHTRGGIIEHYHGGWRCADAPRR